MHSFLLHFALGVLSVLGAAPALFAHGGSYRPPPTPGPGAQYRGPLDIVSGNPTPSGRPTGPTTPGPSAPTTPAPNTPGPSTPRANGPMTPGPTTPGPAGPTTGRAGPTTGPRGVPIGPDDTSWDLWWRYNRNRYLDLKRVIYAPVPVTGSDAFFMGRGFGRGAATDTLRPPPSMVSGRVVPALIAALQRTDERDVVSSCLIALAKIWRGGDGDTTDLVPLLRQHLSSRDQEIRETAALALGISQLPHAIGDLNALALDTPTGRKLCDRTSVDHRTRAFACYGLGLVGRASSRGEAKQQCFETLQGVLRLDTPDRDLPVAAIHGIRLLRPDPNLGARHRRLREACVYELWTYFERDLGPGRQIIQSHVPPAIASVLGRGGDTRGDFKDAFALELADRGGSSRSNDMFRSAALALGMLCQPREVTPADGRYSDALLRYARAGKDQQARRFCLIALGQIGGASNRAALLQVLDRGSKAMEQPWAAIALGVLAYSERAAAGAGWTPDATISEALLRRLEVNRNGDAQAAIAIALGLCGDRSAADAVEHLLRRYRQRDRIAGFFCMSLALMEHRRSGDLIRDVVGDSEHRPLLFERGTSALAKLGDKAITTELVDLLRQPHGSLTRLGAIANALAWVGDRRTVEPLLRLLQDESVTPLARAFAAVALGGVADKQLLPWNTDLAADTNYRATVETLTDGANGVLDIL
ncbi:MAG: HEAT repeat domain-containing protein [Planctomycetota bacterium]